MECAKERTDAEVLLESAWSNLGVEVIDYLKRECGPESPLKARALWVKMRRDTKPVEAKCSG